MNATKFANRRAMTSWFLVLACASFAVLATGCGDALEGTSCDLPGEAECDGRQVLQCLQGSNDENTWEEVAICDSGEECELTSVDTYTCNDNSSN
jgi:hypothetical protein